MDGNQGNAPNSERSNVVRVVTTSAHEEYSACKQGVYKSIVDYKRRFNARLNAYTAAIPKEDIAMDFMYGLDNSRDAEFKAEIVNDIEKEVMDLPEDLNAM
jgi:hypothetical protein